MTTAIDSSVIWAILKKASSARFESVCPCAWSLRARAISIAFRGDRKDQRTDFHWRHTILLVLLTKEQYVASMIATLTSKGQITIPLAIRQRLHLQAGDQLEFDEKAPILVARRVVNRAAWESTINEWRLAAQSALQNHPWEAQTAASIVDDLRGGPADLTEALT